MAPGAPATSDSDLSTDAFSDLSPIPTSLQRLQTSASDLCREVGRLQRRSALALVDHILQQDRSVEAWQLLRRRRMQGIPRQIRTAGPSLESSSSGRFRRRHEEGGSGADVSKQDCGTFEGASSRGTAHSLVDTPPVHVCSGGWKGGGHGGKQSDIRRSNDERMKEGDAKIPQDTAAVDIILPPSCEEEYVESCAGVV